MPLQFATPESVGIPVTKSVPVIVVVAKVEFPETVRAVLDALPKEV